MTDAQRFIFKEIDEVGADTLDVISDAEKFNNWMYQTIRPYCSGRVLEIGSGIGNISSHFIKDGFQITLTDIRVQYCKRLEHKFAGQPNVDGVHLMDLVDPEFDSRYSSFFGKFETIFALNVVEHIKEHQLALDNCKKMLIKGGKVVILVPAYQWLYNGMDEDLEHYRRYTADSLSALFKHSEYKVMHQQYFNFVGIFAWFFTGNILRKRNIPGKQMKIYNILVPVFKWIDRFILHKAGLSVIVVGTRR